jgi:branched-chain amino acid transport system ATP-binding protein
VKDIFDIIRQISVQRNTSILLVEQNVKAGLSISSYGYIMENGRIVVKGERSVLENNRSIKEFYLHGGAGNGEIVN